MMCLCESFHLRFQSGKLLSDLHLLGINVPENVIRVSIQLCDDTMGYSEKEGKNGYVQYG